MASLPVMGLKSNNRSTSSGCYWNSGSNDLQHGEIAFQLVLVHVGTIAVPFDLLILDKLVKDVIPQSITNEFASFHGFDGFIEASWQHFDPRTLALLG